MAKQADLELMRSSQNELVRKSEKEVQSLRQDFIQLGETIKSVNQYLKTNKSTELERINERLSNIEIVVKQRNEQLSEMKTEISKLKQDQEQKDRNKKNIENNLSLLKSLEKIVSLENELSKLSKSLAIQQQGQASDKYASAMECKEVLKEKKTRCEGRMGGLKEQVSGSFLQNICQICYASVS
jgi:hypothetical protein